MARELAQHKTYILVERKRLFCIFGYGSAVLPVYADEVYVVVFVHHTLKGKAYDRRSIVADAEFEKYGLFAARFVSETFVAPRRFVPRFVLHEVYILADIDFRFSPAHGALRYERGRDTAITLLHSHPADKAFVIVQSIVTALCSLKFSVIALHGKDTIGIETRLIKLRVHICGDNETIFISDDSEQRFI